MHIQDDDSGAAQVKSTLRHGGARSEGGSLQPQAGASHARHGRSRQRGQVDHAPPVRSSARWMSSKGRVTCSIAPLPLSALTSCWPVCKHGEPQLTRKGLLLDSLILVAAACAEAHFDQKPSLCLLWWLLS